MKTKVRRYRWIVGLLAGIAVLGAVAAGAQAARPAGMSPEEYRALGIRSQALNELYGGGAPQGMSPAEYRALHIRSEALNKLHGNLVTRLTSSEFRGSYVRSAALNRRYGPTGSDVPPVAVAPVTTVSGDGFDWEDAGIGAGTVLGLTLLAAAALSVGVRHFRVGRAHTTA